VDWLAPKNLTKLPRLFGICSYYQQFIKGFSQLGSPLTNLTKKGAFRWMDESDRAFNKLKEVMSSCLVLALPDFSQPFVLECDASGEHIGVLLMQKGHLIAFESWKLQDSKILYIIYNKEILAIIYALAKFKQYLVGSRFIVKTYHNCLHHFVEQKNLNEQQHKWVSKNQAYDFDIEYVKGKKNVVANALSKKPTSSLMEITNDWKAHLLVEYFNNKFACALTNGLIQDDKYKIINDIIFYKDRIYLVPESTLKEKILRATHDAYIVGHKVPSKRTNRLG